MQNRQTVTIMMVAAVMVGQAAVETAYAQTAIPDWVKDVAGFWADGLIDDDAYAGTIEYLISEGIISVEAPPASTTATSSECTDSIERVLLGMGMVYTLTYMNDNALGTFSHTTESRNIFEKGLAQLTDISDKNLDEIVKFEDVCEGEDGFGSLFVVLARDHMFDQSSLTSNTPTTGTPDILPQAEGVSREPSLFDYELVDVDTSLFKATTKECSQTGGLVHVPAVIENTGSQESNVQYQVHIMTENGTIINSSQMLELWNLSPGTSAHTNNKVPGVDKEWSKCGITIESATARVTKDVSDPSPPDTSTENNILDIDIIKCEQSSSQYVNVEGRIKNLSTRTYDVNYIYYVADSNQDIITFDTAKIWDLRPGQIEFLDKVIRYSGSWEYCGIRTTGVE